MDITSRFGRDYIVRLSIPLALAFGIVIVVIIIIVVVIVVASTTAVFGCCDVLNLERV
jgi:hypothetical protein